MDILEAMPADSEEIAFAAKIFLTMLFTILALMGVIGNIMVITVVLKVPGMVSGLL